MEPYGFGNHGFPTDLDMVGAMQLDWTTTVPGRGFGNRSHTAKHGNNGKQRIGKPRIRATNWGPDSPLTDAENGSGLRAHSPFTGRASSGKQRIHLEALDPRYGFMSRALFTGGGSNGTQRIGKQRIGASDFGHSFG